MNHQILADVAVKERENAAVMHKAQVELQTAKARMLLTTTDLIVAQSHSDVNDFLRLKDAPDKPAAEPAAVVAPATDYVGTSQLTDDGAGQDAALPLRADQPAWAAELLQQLQNPVQNA